jgi:hypothetical protein
MGSTSGAESVFSSGGPDLTIPFLVGSYCFIFSFLCSVLWITVFPFILCPLYCLSFDSIYGC